MVCVFGRKTGWIPLSKKRIVEIYIIDIKKAITTHQMTPKRKLFERAVHLFYIRTRIGDTADGMMAKRGGIPPNPGDNSTKTKIRFMYAHHILADVGLE